MKFNNEMKHRWRLDKGLTLGIIILAIKTLYETIVRFIIYSLVTDAQAVTPDKLRVDTWYQFSAPSSPSSADCVKAFIVLGLITLKIQNNTSWDNSNRS